MIERDEAATIAKRPKPYVPLGKRLAELRGKRWSQVELARSVGISPGYLANLESGYTRPSTEVLKDLARVLGADYNELSLLAEYQQTSPGGITISGDSAEASNLRRIVGFAPSSTLQRMADAVTALARGLISLDQLNTLLDLIVRQEYHPPSGQPPQQETEAGHDEDTGSEEDDVQH